MQAKPEPKSQNDERILKVSGQNIFTLTAIRQKGDYIGFSIKINETPISVIMDTPMATYVWHQTCFSMDQNGYFRFNFNGETLLTQRIRNDVNMVFSTKTTLLFGSEDKKVF